MSAYPDFDSALSDSLETPVELLVAGCSLSVADGFANALRNQGQAAHLKTADSIESLDQQLQSDSADIIVVSADSSKLSPVEAVGKVRAHNPAASILLASKKPADRRSIAIDHGLQDLLDIRDEEHVALAVRREHQTLLLRRETAQLKRQLDEAEERANLLVQSSRDAIAYIHEGMYLNVNQAYLDLFGYDSSDEIDGLPIMDMIGADSRSDFKSALRKVEENGRHAGEYACVTSGGEGFSARMEFSSASIDGEHCTQVMIRDQSQSLALQKRIEELTSKDPQTGFFNRLSFMERLEALVANHERTASGHALVQLSISNFPSLRETCGYGCAEEVLIEVATVLAATASNAHTVARFGDHDFMVVCEEEESAMQVAERCLQGLRTHKFKTLGDAPVQPVYSVGVTRAESGAEITAHELINRSCRATGLARSEGENRVAFYNEEATDDTRHLAEADAAVVKLIDNALANDGFRLKYQPIVSLQGDTRENYSVYLRLINDKGQELVPDVFLSPARDASRLAEVDRWVVRNAIRELANHRRDGKKIIFYIILSRAGIEDDSMLLWIVDCLREFRAKGSWLVFQFRESDLRNAIKPARDLISGLRKINCRVALNHYQDPNAADKLLKHIDVDVVKLSPELMRDLATNNAAQERMGEINGQLQRAGYKTIASGVEDAGSLAILWNIGVNYIQGYFLQEPSNTITFDEEAVS